MLIQRTKLKKLFLANQIMPEITKIRPKNGEIIAVWEITEPESFFIDKISEQEGAKSRQIRSVKKRLEWLAVRALLAENGINEIVEYETNGKPVIKRGYISISHCFPYSVIYFSSLKEIGVDIERIGERILKIADRFVNIKDELDFERKSITDLTIIWGAKEAIYKKYRGETVHFEKNIFVRKVEHKEFELKIKVKNGAFESEESMFYQLIEDFVLVYTS